MTFAMGNKYRYLGAHFTITKARGAQLPKQDS